MANDQRRINEDGRSSVSRSLGPNDPRWDRNARVRTRNRRVPTVQRLEAGASNAEIVAAINTILRELNLEK